MIRKIIKIKGDQDRLFKYGFANILSIGIIAALNNYNKKIKDRQLTLKESMEGYYGTII